MMLATAPSSNALHVVPPTHRYRYHRLSFHNHHMSASTLVLSQSTFATESIDAEGANAHIFLRFSPLIGGPSFLPLHVEVIIAVEARNSNEEMNQNMNTIYIRRSNNISSTSFLKEQLVLHRFDFLPEKPTDPVSLSRLVTLRSVPARVRHRSYISNSNNMQTDDMNGVDKSIENQDGKGITILIPVGSIPSSAYDGENTSTNDIISTAINYKNEYKDSLFRELSLLGGKNCLQFALDLLAHIDETSTGIQRVNGLNAFQLDIN